MNNTGHIEHWEISLGTRNNLFHDDIPYVPILVEDIPIYLSFEDHDENGIKQIQTVGEFIPQSELRAMLLSLTPGNNTKFPISIKNLSVNDIYLKDPRNKYYAEKHVVFKVYGILMEISSESMLETTHLVPIHDVKGTWNVMRLLVAATRSEYRYYYRTEGQNNTLQSQWENMKEDGKRIIEDTSDSEE